MIQNIYLHNYILTHKNVFMENTKLYIPKMLFFEETISNNVYYVSLVLQKMESIFAKSLIIN